jgi:lipoate-protein ligase B
MAMTRMVLREGLAMNNNSSLDTLRNVRFWRPGQVEYERALAWQNARIVGLASGSEGEVIALLEHPPVYTLGVRGKDEHFLSAPDVLAIRGASIVRTNRGGDVTFHGPGQLVVYPILDLRARGLGAAAYVRALEATIVEALITFGVTGERIRGRPGVWVDGAKLAAIGVRISRGVSSHGLALNVSTDLDWFDAIIPCGIPDIKVTSLERLLAQPLSMQVVEDALIDAFARVFDSLLHAGPAAAHKAFTRAVS